MWTLGPGSETGSPSRSAVPCWDVLRESPTEELSSLLLQKRILLSCMVESKQDEKLWSLPVLVRSDFPRQSIAVPIQPNAGNPLITRWVRISVFSKNNLIVGALGEQNALLHNLVSVCICFRALVVTYLEHLGINYIAVSEDPCPRMLIHNRCPRALLLKENLRGIVCTHIHLGKKQLCLEHMP